MGSDAGDAAMLKMCNRGPTPWWQKFLWGSKPFRTKVRGRMAAFMVKNDEHVESCRKRLREALARLEPMLEKQPFNDGSANPTATAIAFSALMAAVAFPPEYCFSFYG